MNPSYRKTQDLLFGKNIVFRITIYAAITIFLSNLNALVDTILHPEIPYLDPEHLIVGGVTFIVITVLFSLLTVYEIRLKRTLARVLEDFMSICSYCKRIRIPALQEEHMDAWQPIEFYIAEKVSTRFSHGICPECFENEFPELHKKNH